MSEPYIYPSPPFAGVAYGTRVLVADVPHAYLSDQARPPSDFAQDGEMGKHLVAGGWSTDPCVVTPDVLDVLDTWVEWTERVCTICRKDLPSATRGAERCWGHLPEEIPGTPAWLAARLTEARKLLEELAAETESEWEPLQYYAKRARTLLSPPATSGEKT